MPTHKIHLAIAKKVNDKLNMNLDEIMLGSILPDLSIKQDHKISHFQHGEKDLEGLSNPDLFIKKYKDKLNNPIFLGYAIHLLSDRYYNEYIFKNFYIYDENDNGIGIYLKGKKTLLNDEERKNLKHREMWIYERWLLNHNYVPKFKDDTCANKVVDIDDAQFNKEKLKEYINSSNKDIDSVNFLSKLFIYRYKITNKKELDIIFNGCIDYIFTYLEKYNIK